MWVTVCRIKTFCNVSFASVSKMREVKTHGTQNGQIKSGLVFQNSRTRTKNKVQNK